MESNLMENNTPDTTQKTPEAQLDNSASGEKEQSLFAGKYHSVDALEQGYKELSRLVREKTPEAPEEYNLDFSDQPELAQALGEVNIKEDPLWQHMTPAMREANLTQDQAKNVAQAFVGWQQQQAEAERANFEALGAEGQAMARQVNRFIEKNLPEEQAQLAQGLASSVDGLKFLSTLAEAAGEKSIPAESYGKPENSRALKEKALQMLADPDLQYNREKQDAYNRLWQDIEAMEG